MQRDKVDENKVIVYNLQYLSQSVTFTFNAHHTDNTASIKFEIKPHLKLVNELPVPVQIELSTQRDKRYIQSSEIEPFTDKIVHNM